MVGARVIDADARVVRSVRAPAPALVEAVGRHAGRLTGGAPRRAPAADGDAVAVEDERALGITARQRRDQARSDR